MENEEVGELSCYICNGINRVYCRVNAHPRYNYAYYPIYTAIAPVIMSIYT